MPDDEELSSDNPDVPADDDEEVDGVGDPEDDDSEVEVGAEAADADGSHAEDAGVVRPSGRDLIELLAGDPEAQRIMSAGLSDMQRRQAAEAAAEQDRSKFAELVKNEDFEAIGRQVMERSRAEESRTAIADEILSAQYEPVYAELFSQPELSAASAEEKQALAATNFQSDAHYVSALSEFIATKRASANLEAEVEKRFQARVEAAQNEAVAGKAKRPLGLTPVPMEGAVTGKRTSSDLIKSGLRHIFEPDQADDDGDDN